MKRGKEVVLISEVYCDGCKQRGFRTVAVYDAKTKMGVWAYLCERHFKQYGVGLGWGKGQRIRYAKE